MTLGGAPKFDDEASGNRVAASFTRARIQKIL